MSDSTIEIRMPPMTAIASGWSICDPAPDQRGDAEYKTAMAGEMTQRALRTARSRAGK